MAPAKLTLWFITFLLGHAMLMNGQDMQEVITTNIGNYSIPAHAEVKLTLKKRFQAVNYKTSSPDDHYDGNIISPKSAEFSEDGSKLYVQALEGYRTVVYDANTWNRIKVIKHDFDENHRHLFLDTTVFDYQYRYRKHSYNHFKGKPVESTTSHHGKYHWVTYYRRSYDRNAVSPSGVAIIDTETDSIVRVMPTGPLPKMIACSPDNKHIAITHWGDNTSAIIDISSDNPADFRYVKHFVVEYRMKLDFEKGEKVNRDNGCGFCLRGTTFTPDGKYLLIGRMGGNGGIAIFDMDSMAYLGNIHGMKHNLRHIIINNGWVIIGTNKSGYVQKARLNDLIESRLSSTDQKLYFKEWENCYVGEGVRTISATKDGKYIFACVNDESKIVVVRSSDMKIVSKIDADSFPVGMALGKNDTELVVTSQGKSRKGGHSVMVFSVAYQ